MFSKLNLKTLLIIVLVLLVIVLAVTYFDAKKGERTFKSDLVTIDTSQVTEMIIFPMNEVDDVTKFVKTGNTWFIQLDDKSMKADQRVVKNLLSMLLNLKAERVAATSKSQWDKYEVGDSTGLQVQVKKGDELVADVIVGKFSYMQPKAGAQQMNQYNQQKGTMTSYVRLNKEKEVYAVNGYLKMNFTMDLNNYRDKTLVNVNKNDITSLKFDYPADSSFMMVKEDDNWMINGSHADSTEAVSYISQISRLMNYDFVEDIGHSDTPEYQLTIEGNNFSPVVLKAFLADTTNKFVITSTENQDGLFSGAKSGLTEKIFVSKNKF